MGRIKKAFSLLSSPRRKSKPQKKPPESEPPAFPNTKCYFFFLSNFLAFWTQIRILGPLAQLNLDPERWWKQNPNPRRKKGSFKKLSKRPHLLIYSIGTIVEHLKKKIILLYCIPYPVEIVIKPDGRPPST